MANGKPKGNKNYGGKKPKGKQSKGKGTSTSVNPDVKAAKGKNASLYTTKKTTKKRSGSGGTTPKMDAVQKIKDSTPMRNRDIDRLIGGIVRPFK